MDNIPQELFDDVIDYLQDDKQSLRVCSLVCHSWQHRAQHHVFSKLHPTEAKITKFMDFLEATPHVCNHIRTLHLDLGSITGIAPLRDFLELLPRIDDLRLSWREFKLSSHSGPPTYVHRRQLNTLSITVLRNGFFDHIVALATILRLFSNVDTLHIDFAGVLHSESDDNFDSVLQNPSSGTEKLIIVRSVVLRPPSMTDEVAHANIMYQFLHSILDTRALKHIAIQSECSHAVHGCSHFLQDIGHNLESLYLDLTLPDDDELDGSIIHAIRETKVQISACIELRVLRFALDYPQDWSVMEEMHGAMIDVLVEISPTIREITIEMWCLPQALTEEGLKGGFAKSVNWRRLELALRRLTNLQTLLFEVRQYDTEEAIKELEELMTVRLPGLSSAGVMKFVGNDASRHHNYSL